jgi:hypothetical protein
VPCGAIHVQSAGRDEVSGANVLVGLFSERESNALYFLHEQGMSRLDATNYISHGIGKRTTSFLIADDRFAAADRALHVAAEHQRAGSGARALADARLAFAVLLRQICDLTGQTAAPDANVSGLVGVLSASGFVPQPLQDLFGRLAADLELQTRSIPSGGDLPKEKQPSAHVAACLVEMTGTAMVCLVEAFTQSDRSP